MFVYKGAEFDVYDDYIKSVTNKKLQDRLYALLKREDLTALLNSYDQGFKDVVKYLLPRLLEGPIHHIKYCFNTMLVSTFYFTKNLALWLVMYYVGVALSFIMSSVFVICCRK